MSTFVPPLTLEAATAMVAHYQGRPGRKPKNYQDALSMVQANQVQSANNAASTANSQQYPPLQPGVPIQHLPPAPEDNSPPTPIVALETPQDCKNALSMVVKQIHSGKITVQKGNSLVLGLMNLAKMMREAEESSLMAKLEELEAKKAAITVAKGKLGLVPPLPAPVPAEPISTLG